MNSKSKWLCMLFLAFCLLVPSSGAAQTVTKTFKNALLKNVLHEVERQTKMSIIYKVDEVNEKKVVNATFQKTPVKEVLQKVLDSDMSFDIDKKMIVIHKKKENKPATVGQVEVKKGHSQQVKGQVVDSHGEPLIGVSVMVKGTSQGAITDIDGNYVITTDVANPVLVYSYVGFANQSVAVNGRNSVDITMSEDSNSLDEVVVTAMGIVRKATSLTYATQQVKSDDLMRVEDVNLVNSLDGKISGVTITPGAGGAGGASKILLRGNKSIQGNNSPLIVVDGIPMSNSTRGRIGSAAKFIAESGVEGGDPLSQINPDDIESINVLKGANAAALYGSAAANGVVMITTKKGKEGRLDISFNSNVTFDTPLLTPEIQGIYGIGFNDSGEGFNGLNAWGDKMTGEHTTYTKNLMSNPQILAAHNQVHLRNYNNDDVADFFKTGVTTNNSFSLSGGTDKAKSYMSYANSHSTGMVPTNSYNRHTFAYRQNYRLWNRLTIEGSANYVQTRTKNRVGGGTALNPIFNLYTTPRNIDMEYYRNNYVIQNGNWKSNEQTYWADGVAKTGRALLKGPMQNWAFQSPIQNNPYWLMNMNAGKKGEDRFYGNFQARIDIIDGLAFQSRVSIDHTKYFSEAHRSATTWDPATINDYGRYWISNGRTNEIYIDNLLTYNNTIKQDWTVNATAGWVEHTTKGETVATDVGRATVDMTKNGIQTELPTVINLFVPSAGNSGVTSKSNSSNWDKAALMTASVGWKDAIYVDGSYRMDWYRAFKQGRFLSAKSATKAKDHYGYFGFGANAIISNLVKLPEQISYLKYRVSYSEVGNSIPNIIFDQVSVNYATGASSGSKYNSFTPKPETMKSFETGIEAQFFNNALNFDLTYYNTKLDGAYLTVSGTNGKPQPVTTSCVRNQGIELTIGYDWIFAKNWRWKTSANFSYNDNKILEVYTDKFGNEKTYDVKVANGVNVRYIKGGKYGDMYVNDYTRWETDVYKNASGVLNTTGDGELVHKAGDIYVGKDGKPSFSGNYKWVNPKGGVRTKPGKRYTKYLGNMNSNYQLSWSNTLSYKNLTMFFLINGRIGGKVISLTESYLDNRGLSQRSADARLKAEKSGVLFKANDTDPGVPGMYINEGRDIVPVQGYFEAIGSNDASSYVYDATNFRLRELSLGYTFRNLMGEGKNLSVSFIGRNLFFLYKKAPVDPDVSLSSANGLGGFEMFNLPSSRSFGFNLKLNF